MADIVRSTRQKLSSAHREIRDLRAVLGEFLDQEEEMALGNYPLADQHGPARLNRILAHEMRYGYGADVHREDLRRIKRARRALGLPAWWDQP